MSDDDHRTFEDMLRDIVEEVSESLERVSEVDVEGVVRSFGLDPERGREWFTGAAQWFKQQTSTPGATPSPAPASKTTWDQAEPHPLDLPTAAQGAALAALDSGRWAIEPGTSALTVAGDGPGPSDALALVRALRVRDWLRADGTVTVAGTRALERWLAATPAP